ncbi:MAG: ATP-binding cassette domain-containing protein [Caldilineaceae bacterium]
MLEISNLYVGYYRDLNILQGVSLTATEGKITTILGANGVGKSTMLKAVYGFLKPNEGNIVLDGESILGVPTHERINRGLAYIPQQPGVFRWMSVEENLEVGADLRCDKQRIKQKLDENYARFPILRDKRKQMTGELSGGQQRMVEIGRTLMTDPKVILVDEPTAGSGQAPFGGGLSDAGGSARSGKSHDSAGGPGDSRRAQDRRLRLRARTGAQQVRRPGGRVPGSGRRRSGWMRRDA